MNLYVGTNYKQLKYKDMKTIKRHLEQRVNKLRIKSQLRYIKKQIENECVSYGEIIFLQNNISYIDKNDVILLEWAGVEENN